MLAVVLGFAALIEKVPSGDQATSYARRIVRCGVRMERLVGDLVDVASIAAGALAVTREQADLTPVIMEAVDTFHQRAADAGVRLAVDLAPSLTGAAFDPARVLQVLTNLSPTPSSSAHPAASSSSTPAAWETTSECRSATRDPEFKRTRSRSCSSGSCR